MRSAFVLILLTSLLANPAHAIIGRLLSACGIKLGTAKDVPNASGTDSIQKRQSYLAKIAEARGRDVIAIDASADPSSLLTFEAAALEHLSPDSGRIVFRDGGFQEIGAREVALISQLTDMLDPATVTEVTKRFGRLANNGKISRLVEALVEQKHATQEQPFTIVIQNFTPTKNADGHYSDDLSNLLRSMHNDSDEVFQNVRIVISSSTPKSDWGSAQGGFNVGTPIILNKPE